MKYIKLIISVASFLLILGGGIYAQNKLGFIKTQPNIDNSQKEIMAEVPVQASESPPATESETIESKPQPLVLGIKTKLPSGLVVNLANTKPSTDLVPSTDPIVTSLPTPPTSAVWDFCNNLEGNQMVLPDGYYRAEDNNCFPKTGTWDFCLNLIGNQLVVPEGYYIDENNNCLVDTTKLILKPQPADNSLNPDCAKNGTGYISVQVKSQGNPVQYWDHGTLYTHEFNYWLYRIESSGEKLIFTNSAGAMPPGKYQVRASADDVFVVPQIATLEQCGVITFVIDKAK